jgi:hypothetical protein
LIAGYIGGGKAFTESIRKFAAAYAEQTDKDWKLLGSKKSG